MTLPVRESIYNDMIIGVMDSGIGGLNVLASLIRRRAADGYLYLADNENLPYGDKRAEDLRKIAERGVAQLSECGANAIVFGCNTLTATSLDYLRKRVAPPLFGLFPRPELCHGKTLILTTPTTALYLPKLEENVSLLTPARLASLVEEEYPATEKTRAYLRPLLLPYRDAECVYLGCTHYLYARAVVGELLPEATFRDGTGNLADLVAALLPAKGGDHPDVRFLFNGRDRSERYSRILSDILG